MSSDEEKASGNETRTSFEIRSRNSIHPVQMKEKQALDRQPDQKDIDTNPDKNPVPEIDGEPAVDEASSSSSQSVQGEGEISADEVDGPEYFDAEKSINSTNTETADTTNDKQPLASPNKQLPHPTKIENATAFLIKNKGIILIVFIIIGLIVCIFKHFTHPMETLSSPINVPKTCDGFLQMKDKYPKLDNFLWKTLKVNVDKAMYKDPGVPGTFIFLFNTTKTEKEFLDEVVRITKNCSKDDIDPIDLSSSDLNTAELMNDHGIFITTHREQLEKNFIMVVHDLNQISPKVVQVFHSFCDTHEPIVHKAVIFFTLYIGNEELLKTNETLAFVENYLRTLWNTSLKPNILDPLVTRLTENVFFIY